MRGPALRVSLSPHESVTRRAGAREPQHGPRTARPTRGTSSLGLGRKHRVTPAAPPPTERDAGARGALARGSTTQYRSSGRGTGRGMIRAQRAGRALELGFTCVQASNSEPLAAAAAACPRQRRKGNAASSADGCAHSACPERHAIRRIPAGAQKPWKERKTPKRGCRRCSHLWCRQAWAPRWSAPRTRSWPLLCWEGAARRRTAGACLSAAGAACSRSEPSAKPRVPTFGIASGDRHWQLGQTSQGSATSPERLLCLDGE